MVTVLWGSSNTPIPIGVNTYLRTSLVFFFRMRLCPVLLGHEGEIGGDEGEGIDH